jgi:ATP-dependent phosphofructokinase / diphosphate-dependent phosphofructokinase
MSSAASDGRLALLVGGGPAPGINGVISAATIEACNQGMEVVGVQDGFRWLMQGETGRCRPLGIADVKDHALRGGSILGTSRANPARSPSDLSAVLRALQGLGVMALVSIGGDDTAYSASQVHRRAGGSIRVAHVPKTIDNDLPLPDSAPTFGFETARHLGVGIVRNLAEDARTTSRWYLIVSMGRAAGFLALGIGKAAAATLTVIPEEFRDRRVTLDEVCDVLIGAVIKRRSQGSPFGVAVLAEGLLEAFGEEGLLRAVGSEEGLRRYGRVDRDEHGHLRLGEVEFGRLVRDHLARRSKALGISLPVTLVDKDLGYELRCADPIPFDAEYTRDLGYGAVKFLRSESAGEFGAVISFVAGRMKPLPFAELIVPQTGLSPIVGCAVNPVMGFAAPGGRLGGDVQRQDPLLADLLGPAAAPLPAQLVAEEPLVGLRVVLHVGQLALVQRPHRVALLVHLHPPVGADPPPRHVPAQVKPRRLQAPALSLPARAVGPPPLPQLRVQLPAAQPAHPRVALALDPVHLVQPLLQLPGPRTRRRLHPGVRRPVRALHHPVLLRVARPVEVQGQPQPRQPQRQRRRQLAPDAPGVAVVQAQAARQAPARERLPQRLLHPPPLHAVPGRGEDDRLRDRPGALVDQAQPADQRAGPQAQLVGGIDLPDLVGGAGAAPLGGLAAAAGGGQARLPEPAADGRLAGRVVVEALVLQPGAEQAGAPAGVLLAQGQDLLALGGAEGGGGRAAAVAGRPEGAAAEAALPEDVAGGAGRQLEAVAQGGGVKAAEVGVPEGQARGQWDEAGHGGDPNGGRAKPLPGITTAPLRGKTHDRFSGTSYDR